VVNALKFYASVRLDIRRIGRHQEWRRSDRQHDARVKSGEEQSLLRRSGKLSSRSCTDRAFSREGEIIELASANGIIDKSGAWYSYKGNRIGQGKDNVRTFLQGK